MKKLAFVVLLTTVVITNSYGFGLGLEGYSGGVWGRGNNNFALPGGLNGGVGLSFGFGKLADPWALAGLSFNAHGGGSGAGLGVSAHFDWALINHKVVSWFYLYLNAGIGLSATFGVNRITSLNSGTSFFNLGAVARLPLGMRFALVNHLEIFLELVPDFGLGVYRWREYAQGSTTNKGVGVGFIGGIGATLGARWWF